MDGVIKIQLWQFLIVYLLLLVVLLIMKICHVDKAKQLIVASIKMTIQLVLAGYILAYIFDNPHPLFVILYIVLMISFTIYRVLSKNKELNKKFKIVVAVSIIISGLSIIIFFIGVVVGVSLFNPQYVIPISGMVMGNTMTGVSLGLKTFKESIKDQRSKINALMCLGADPKDILLPLVKQSLETAMLPTLNSMVGMGIVSLPGMMTGQILAGTIPTTAILYQIAIMIAICTVVTCSSFGSLYFGFKTMYNRHDLIINI